MPKKLLLLGLAAAAALMIGFLVLRTESPPAKQKTVEAPSLPEQPPSPQKSLGTPASAPSPARPKQQVAKPELVPPLKTEVIVKNKWGSAAGHFGRKKEEEANSEAPMAILGGAAGEFVVVDQVNQRAQRFRDGKVVGTISASETVQDIADGPGGKTVLLDRLADQKVQLFDAEGKLINEAPITGKGLEAGGNATGVFMDEEGIWVENDHTSLVRVADANGNVDEERPELPGRPTRDGRAVVTAAITDRAAGKLVLSAFDRRTLEVLWSVVIELPLPILHLLALESDAAGFTYVAADVGREASEAPFAIIDEQIVVVRVSPSGAVTGMISLPATATGDEMLRPLSVGADGSVYLMSPSEEGMAINRYTFP